MDKYQEGLEGKMRGIDFFYSVDLLHYNLHKIRLNRGGSCIYSPKWLKNKTETINTKNKDDKCFQNALSAVLNYDQIKSHSHRISNIKPFINQHDWKETNFPSYKKDWNKFGKNNKIIALNILYVPYNTEEIRHANKSKYNKVHKHHFLSCRKKIICIVYRKNIKT